MTPSLQALQRPVTLLLVFLVFMLLTRAVEAAHCQQPWTAACHAEPRFGRAENKPDIPPVTLYVWRF